MITTAEYTCETCGKQFTRKKSFKAGEKVLCIGCKRKEYFKEHPEALEASLQHKAQTMLERYGVDNPSKSTVFKKKISEKLTEFYRVEDNKSKALAKKEATNVERFGVKYPSQDPRIVKAYCDKQVKEKGYVGWQNSDLQKAAEEKAHSTEAKSKRKATWKKNYGVDHPSKHEAIKQKKVDTYKANTGYDHPQHNPEIIHSNKGYLYKDIHFDSSWELAYYIWLTDNNRSFLYHPNMYLEYVDKDNVTRKYQPDFLIEGVFYEIKGDQFFNEKEEPWNQYTKDFWWEKYNALVNNNVVILREKDMRNYLKYVKDTYGKSYLKSFRTSKINQSSTTILKESRN